MRREPDVYTILSQLEIGHFMLVLQSLNEFPDGQIEIEKDLSNLFEYFLLVISLRRQHGNDTHFWGKLLVAFKLFSGKSSLTGRHLFLLL
jgi:hypothetical protein